MTGTPIYDQLMREHQARRRRDLTEQINRLAASTARVSVRLHDIAERRKDRAS